MAGGPSVKGRLFKPLGDAGLDLHDPQQFNKLSPVVSLVGAQRRLCFQDARRAMSFANSRSATHEVRVVPVSTTRGIQD